MHQIPASELFKQLTAAEAAEFMNTSPSTLERRRRDGTGPKYLKINPRVVRYRLVDLIEHQEAHLVPQEAHSG